jgi:replicative DNA helicase
VDEIIRSIQRRRVVNKTRLAIIDYATLMRAVNTGGKTGRAQDMLKHAALSLQIASKELDIAILLVSQLNRGLESRDDRRPTMSDIRDAGELEEFSKFIIGLYRGFYYVQSQPRPERNIDYDCIICDQSLARCNHAPTNEEWARQIQYLILKNSNGPTGVVYARWDGPTVSVW